MTSVLTNFSQQFGLTPLTAPDKPTIFVMVHGADGSIASFYELARGLNLPLVAVSYVPSEVSACESIEEFAAIYLAQLATYYPETTYILAGHSFGGLVAFEMAKMLALEGQRAIPAFLLDPNLPLAMRNYQAERLLELRVLASTIFSQELIEKHQVYDCEENKLLELLHRCLKPPRLEGILDARKHCLRALSHYVYCEHPEVKTEMIHASERLAYDFTDQDTKCITVGRNVGGNHFTMLNVPHIEDLRAHINLKLGQYV